ncbi:hypothetical protein ACGF5O_15190 [Streptomyces sp. NPDC048291]|uniref:hypothetical protein n=1 Tax=Streptomyces sp. NPDC048291 TaxID=3365530 RepID=UPI0037205D43
MTTNEQAEPSSQSPSDPSSEASAHDGHPRLSHLRDQLTEHHRRARAEREEAELEEAVGSAAFDLGADIAHPAPDHAAAAYDVDTDIGVDPR